MENFIVYIYENGEERDSISVDKGSAQGAAETAEHAAQIAVARYDSDNRLAKAGKSVFAEVSRINVNKSGVRLMDAFGFTVSASLTACYDVAKAI